jgi:hypothetical protein
MAIPEGNHAVQAVAASSNDGPERTRKQAGHIGRCLPKAYWPRVSRRLVLLFGPAYLIFEHNRKVLK